MAQLLDLFQRSLFLGSSSLHGPRDSPTFYYRKSRLYCGNSVAFQKYRGVLELLDPCNIRSVPHKAQFCDGEDLDAFPNVQTLRDFRKEELLGKVVMVRFDSDILLEKNLEQESSSDNIALSTIKYLYEAGAKVILVGNWNKRNNLTLCDTKSAADLLSSILQLKVIPKKIVSGDMRYWMEDGEKSSIILLENLSRFKEESANCPKFAEQLSSGVDIFVNDAFSQSHKVLASTVGVTCFCYACIAGFYFEESLRKLKKAIKTNKKPYVAIIGGGNLLDKAAAVRFLASRCDGLVFVGNIVFQIMDALGLPVPAKLLESAARREALNIIQLASSRSVPILVPKDFWCINESLPKHLEVFSAHFLSNGWLPFDLGPKSLDAITSMLLKCEKVMWIGPVKFSLPSQDTIGASKLARLLDRLSQNNCDVTVVGTMACLALMRESKFVSNCNIIEDASVMWEILKGRTLPGLMALDRGFPFEIDWDVVYNDSALPLVVDIGSGNGLFILGMACRRSDINFLGLELNDKLVTRCLDSVQQLGIKNGHFIATNATTTFGSIVSSYPGKLVLVSIQCPNPDFNKPEHRWRMVQRSLVEAIIDLLSSDGKIFLQSDIEEVAVRMREQFIEYGKGKLAVVDDDSNGGGWLKENPFGVRSDWEQHVVDKGNPMYRLMLSKSTNAD